MKILYSVFCVLYSILLYFDYILWWFLVYVSSGSGAGLYPKASRLFLHQERAELAGWLDARKQEEERGRQEKEGSWKAGKTHFVFVFFVSLFFCGDN